MKLHHIALFTDGIWPHIMGGMQKHSYYIAKYFAQKKIFVDVYHAVPYGKKAPDSYSEFNGEELKYLKFIPVSFPRNHRFPGHYMWESYCYSKQLCRQFMQQESRVDFVYIQGFSGWYFLKNNSNKLPNGINFHGLNMFQKAPSLTSKLQCWLFRPAVKKNLHNADFAISLGGKLNQIVSRYSNNMKVIPIGIGKEWIIEKTKDVENKVRFVFIGRYDKVKGIKELTHVLRDLAGDFRFDFIGPIPEKYKINDIRIHYYGAIHDEDRIKNILANSDVLVCPSWSEGMPTVILEAMASGCAVLATNVGAVSEQVDETTGILIEPGNINALTAALNQILNLNRDVLHKMKLNATQKVRQKFLWEQVINQTIEWMESQTAKS